MIQSATAKPGAISHRRALSLAQFVAVLVSLAVLIGVAVPALRQQVERGRSTRCSDNLARIARGLRLYHFDYDAWPEARVSTQAGLVKDQNIWIELVAGNKYVAQPSTFLCPADPNAPLVDDNPQYYRHEIAHAPSYGLNQLTWLEYGLAPTDDPGVQRSTSRPEQTILLADRGPDFSPEDLPASPDQRRAQLLVARDAGRLPADDGFRMGVVRPPPPWLVPRHAGVLNLVAFAGSTSAAHSRPDPAAPLSKYYDDCATGDCTFCNAFKAPHYDFSSVGLHWWTGPYYVKPGPLRDAKP